MHTDLQTPGIRFPQPVVMEAGSRRCVLGLETVLVGLSSEPNDSMWGSLVRLSSRSSQLGLLAVYGPSPRAA